MAVALLTVCGWGSIQYNYAAIRGASRARTLLHLKADKVVFRAIAEVGHLRHGLDQGCVAGRVYTHASIPCWGTRTCAVGAICSAGEYGCGLAGGACCAIVVRDRRGALCSVRATAAQGAGGTASPRAADGDWQGGQMREKPSGFGVWTPITVSRTPCHITDTDICAYRIPLTPRAFAARRERPRPGRLAHRCSWRLTMSVRSVWSCRWGRRCSCCMAL